MSVHTVDNMPDLPEGMRGYEREYRRGYADGWIQAVEAMHDLMFRDGLTRQAAYDKCWAHWRDALFAWRNDDASRVVLPPGGLTSSCDGPPCAGQLH